MSEETILSVLNESKSVKESGKNFDDVKIEILTAMNLYFIPTSLK